MNFSIQTPLENDEIQLKPLEEIDFENLYQVANDEKIWEQHPNKNRYKREEFQNFFKGAIESKGAFLILTKATHEIAGSTRFYDYDASAKSIFIGYTFCATKFWGTGLNANVKKIMLDYIFQFIDVVNFHVGSTNFRSQKAMEKLGAVKTKEIEVAYFGEPEKTNFQYEIKKENWV